MHYSHVSSLCTASVTHAQLSAAGVAALASASGPAHLHLEWLSSRQASNDSANAGQYGCHLCSVNYHSHSCGLGRTGLSVSVRSCLLALICGLSAVFQQRSRYREVFSMDLVSLGFIHSFQPIYLCCIAKLGSGWFPDQLLKLGWGFCKFKKGLCKWLRHLHDQLPTCFLSPSCEGWSNVTPVKL